MRWLGLLLVAATLPAGCRDPVVLCTDIGCGNAGAEAAEAVFRALEKN